MIINQIEIQVVTDFNPKKDGEVIKPKKGGQVRFLLTNDCSAHCSYCHNEGQSSENRQDLSLSAIKSYLDDWKKHNIMPLEIVLSGGEPTLNKEFLEIAKLCKSYVKYLSVDTHGGHYKKLIPSFKYIDELKVHIDSLNEEANMEQMGVKVSNAKKSMFAAQNLGVNVIINHPMLDSVEGLEFAEQSKKLGIDCKLIQIHLNSSDRKVLDLNLPKNYTSKKEGSFICKETNHKIYLKSCDNADNETQPLYISKNEVRLGMKED